MIPSETEDQKVGVDFFILRLNSTDPSLCQTNVEVSYMEIYNEKVFDLLDWDNSGKKNGLKVRYLLSTI